MRLLLDDVRSQRVRRREASERTRSLRSRLMPSQYRFSDVLRRPRGRGDAWDPPLSTPLRGGGEWGSISAIHLTFVGGGGITRRLEPVTYDDGEEEWTDLSKERVKWLDGKGKGKATQGKAKPATTSRGRVRMYAYRVRCVCSLPCAVCVWASLCTAHPPAHVAPPVRVSHRILQGVASCPPPNQAERRVMSGRRDALGLVSAGVCGGAAIQLQLVR